MKKINLISAVIVCALLTVEVQAQIQVSGLADFVVRNSEEYDITNYTFRGFSNFHTMRTRLFFDGNVDENTDFFAQILVNVNTFQLYGAYARFSELAKNYLNLQVGLIPIPIGSYGPRTYSDKNPLIGTPLLYNFHTALEPSRLGENGTISELNDAKTNRTYYGAPVIYDACWSTGAEFYGSAGKFDYSLGLLFGSVSKPSVDQARNLPQFTTHLVYNFQPGFKVGLSAYVGPYMSKAELDDPEDYFNSGIGYEFYFAKKLLEIYSEGYSVKWEYPGLPDVTALSAYWEAKYKFHPRWYGAVRFDLYEPGKIEVSPGLKEKWDYPVKRIEFGVGYKPLRKATVKLVAQLNRFDYNDIYDSEIYAMQISLPFN